MKISRLAITASILGSSILGNTFAGQARAADANRVRPVVHKSNYAAQDAAAAPTAPSPVTTSLADCCDHGLPSVVQSCGSLGCCDASIGCCDTESSSCGCGCQEDSDGPLRLVDFPFMKDANLFAEGWLAQSYTWNFQNPSDRFNGPVTWTDRSNEYQLNELYTYFGRKIDTSEGFDIGGRVDLLYGTSSRFVTAAGLEDRINKSQSFYGLAIPQFYVEAGAGDLSAKVGHFLSPVGFAAVGTANNFFNALPYTFQYGEPFTHTGALATYKVSDALTLGGGFTRGWDNFSSNYNPHLGYIGTATLTGPAEGTLSYVNMWSREPNFGPARANGAPGLSGRYLQTLVWNRPLTDELTYVAQTDLGVQGDPFGPGGVARWYGLNQYLFYTVSDTLAWGVNFEWFRDEGGFRVGGFLPNFTNNTIGGPTQTRGLPIDRSGYDGSFYQITVGPKWTPSANVMVRPNLRWDWYDGKKNNAAGLSPYNDGQRTWQGILGTDMVVLF